MSIIGASNLLSEHLFHCGLPEGRNYLCVVWCVCVCARVYVCVCIFKFLLENVYFTFNLIFIFKTFVLEIELHHIPSLSSFQAPPSHPPSNPSHDPPPPCTLKLSLIILVTYSYCLSYLSVTLGQKRLV